MQREPYLGHPFLDFGQHVTGLPLADAVHDHIIHVAFERDRREGPGHPRIERVVKEQISQDRRDRGPLWGFPGLVPARYRRAVAAALSATVAHTTAPTVDQCARRPL